MFKLEIGEVPVSTETGGTTELSINLTPIPILQDQNQKLEGHESDGVIVSARGSFMELSTKLENGEGRGNFRWSDEMCRDWDEHQR